MFSIRNNEAGNTRYQASSDPRFIENEYEDINDYYTYINSVGDANIVISDYWYDKCCRRWYAETNFATISNGNEVISTIYGTESKEAYLCFFLIKIKTQNFWEEFWLR